MSRIVEAEQNVIGGVLLVPESYWQVADVVNAADFIRNDHAAIWGAIVEMVRESAAIDVFTLADWIGDHGPYLIQLCSGTPSAANIKAYAEIVARNAEQRRVQSAGNLISKCDSYADAQALLAAVRPTQGARMKSATDGLREMVEALQVRFNADSIVTGTPTGLDSLDMLTGGWQAGDLVGLVGATSSGKTAFALQSAIHAGRCYYVSLEMMASQLFERIVSNVGRIPYRHIRFPKEAPDNFLTVLNDGAGIAKKLPLLVDDQPGLTIEQICARSRQLHMVEPLKLVVVDHMNLIRRPRRNDAAELGEIAIALKNLAKDLGCPVMLLLQVNRDHKSRQDHRPELQDIRASGEIEEALDTAVMIYRDEYYNPQGPLAGYAELIVRKQRAGDRNVTAWAKSYLSEMRFESCDEPERPAGNSAANDGGGGFKAYGAKSNQPRPLSAVSGGR